MPLTAGSSFGAYRIIEPLGRGGMAAVYKAYEAGLDRYIALKVLPAEFLHDPTFAERFRREARVIAHLEHPNIIPIYAYGIDESIPWMAMRLITGGTLARFLAHGRLDPRRGITILKGVAAALDHAHDQGVLHRDVKPQNVLVDANEHVYLADFGIARIVEGSSVLTRTGLITGTPHYMAPEQAHGTKTLDHRCDIYALGIVAYEMLVGHVPFTADTPVAVLMKHLLEPIPLPPPSEVSEAVVRPLLKCMAKDPDDRWPSGTAFVQALEGGMTQESESRSAAVVAPTETLTVPAPAGRGLPAGAVTEKPRAPARTAPAQTAPLSPTTGTGRSWTGRAMLAAAVLLGTCVAVWLYVTSGPPGSVALSVPPPTTVPSEKVQSGVAPASAPPAVAVTPASKAPAAAKAMPDGMVPLVVVLSARQETWVEAKADGTTVLSRVLSQGETQRITARQVILSVGNAGGIALMVNDHAMLPLGKEGELRRNVIIDAQTLPSLISGRASAVGAVPTRDPGASASRGALEQNPVHSLDLGGVPFKGPADAPIRVVEFSDFLCPFCRSLAGGFATFLPQSGNRVAVYFKNYPLEQSCNPHLKTTVHPGACALALGAVCAQDQGRFWPYHDKVYASNPASPSANDVARLAGEAGLDERVFKICLGALETRERLAAQIAEAHAAGVNATPTLYINGRQLPRINDFIQTVDEESARLGLPPFKTQGQ